MMALVIALGVVAALLILFYIILAVALLWIHYPRGHKNKHDGGRK